MSDVSRSLLSPFFAIMDFVLDAPVTAVAIAVAAAALTAFMAIM